MSKQIQLDRFWKNNEQSQTRSTIALLQSEKKIETSVSPRSTSECAVDEEIQCEIVLICEDSSNSASSTINDRGYCSSVERESHAQSISTSTRPKYRTQYLSSWEQRSEALYKTYVIDAFGVQHEQYLRWLYFKGDSMGCRLCEKFGKTRNTNGECRH
jgi:hypothetical protein